MPAKFENLVHHLHDIIIPNQNAALELWAMRLHFFDKTDYGYLVSGFKLRKGTEWVSAVEF
jgi:hypothetical protein